MKTALSILFALLCLAQTAFTPANCNPAFFTTPTVSGGGGGPTLVASDNFTRADSGTLGANWTAMQNGGMQIVGNQAFGGTIAQTYLNIWSANSFNNNQSSEVTVVTTGFGTYAFAGVRISGSPDSENGYVAYCSSGTFAAETAIQKVTGGVAVTLGATDSTPFSNGDKLKISVSGNVLSFYKNGVFIYSRTDSTWTSGSAAAGGYYRALLSHWEGDNL